MASRARALLGQLPVHLGVDLVQPGLGDHAPADGRLVGDQDAGEARTVKSPDRIGCTGQEPDLGRVGQVVNVLDQRPVPVEEDRRSGSPLPALHRDAERSASTSDLARASASCVPMSR